jgi:hypothetical protein
VTPNPSRRISLVYRDPRRAERIAAALSHVVERARVRRDIDGAYRVTVLEAGGWRLPKASELRAARHA